MATETYQLNVSGIAGNEYVENVLHFTSTTATQDETLANGDSLINSWNTNIKQKWLDCLPNTYFLQRLATRRVLIKPSAMAHLQFDAGAEGGQLGAEQTGDQVCPCIFLVPPMGVKSGGRIFMPAVGQGQVVNNTPIAGYISKINILMTAMTANFGISGMQWQLAIVSRKLNQTHNVSSWHVSPVIGFQQKRRTPL